MPVTIQVTTNQQPRSDLSSGKITGSGSLTFEGIAPAPGGNTINTIEDVYNDTFGEASELPHGIPSNYHWATGDSDWQLMKKGRWVSGVVGAGYPQKHTPPNTGKTDACTVAYRNIKQAEAIVPWGVVYRGQNNVWGNNVAVEIARFKIWLRRKDNGVWVQGVNTLTNFWGVYTNEAAGGYQTWTIRNNSNNTGIVIRPPLATDRAIHFASSQRTNTLNAYSSHSNFGGAFATCWARKVKWDSGGVDDLDGSNLMLQVGGDWWRDTSAGNQDCGATVFFNNPYWALGRFRYLTRNFQGYNCCIFNAPATYQEWLGSGKPTLASFQNNSALVALLE